MSGQSHLEVFIYIVSIVASQVIADVLPITASPEFPLETTTASLTCSIALFTGGAEWIKHGSSLTLCQSGLCIPSSSTRYQYSANATSTTVTIPSLDIAIDEGTWTCAYNVGTYTGVYNLTVYKIPSTLSINGPTSRALIDSVTVHLSASTGCIHPSGPEHYSITWKYIEAGSTVEKHFETGITQNITSAGGCAYGYEDNLMLNLYITSKMNPGTTTLYISQIKITFTMAGRNISALLNVAYNITGTDTVSTDAPSSNQLALGLGLGLGLGVPCVISIICVIIRIKKSD